MQSKKALILLIIAVLSVTGVMAQPPGGGGILPGGGAIPNPEVPDLDDIQFEELPDIQVDIESGALRDAIQNPDAVMPTVQAIGENVSALEFDVNSYFNMMDVYEVPEDWSQINLQGYMPTVDEIRAIVDELPQDIDLDQLDIQDMSSPEATSAIIGYASSMLGKSVTPLYAGQYGNVDLSQYPQAQATINQIYGELPADMQAMLVQADNLSGVTYWALLEDGLALVYTGTCEVEGCTIQQDMVQVEITGGSAGAYAVYSNTIPANTNEAQALVQSTYPYLAGLELSQTESEYGTAFFAFDVDMNSGQVTAYYAGVYPSDIGQSIVYVVSGIGDAYINVLLGG